MGSSQPDDLVWRHIEDLSLPYDTRQNPAQSQRLLYVGGSNVITGLQDSAQRRPGFNAALETTPTTFTGDIVRLFGWSTWAGAYFVMLNEVTGSNSVVWKLKIGTDVSFVSLFSSSVTEPFDFVVSNNHVFFVNGTDSKKYDGTTLTNWGIANTAAAPTAVVTAGTGLDATEGYAYVFTYGNSTTGHQSSPSPPSLNTGAFTDEKVVVGGARSTDAQVDKVHIYRTTDGGSGIFFEVTGSPIANPAGAWTHDDTTDDVDLSSTYAPIADHNNPPPSGFKLFKDGYHANRIIGFVNNKMYLSNWEEQTGGIGSDTVVGVPEESFNPRNFFQAEAALLGGGPAGDTFLAMTGKSTWRLTGDSLDTFSWQQFLTGIGTQNRANFCRAGQALMWFDNTTGIRASDGYTEYEFGSPVFSEISNIADHSTVSMEFVSMQFSGTIRKCLFFVNGEDTQIYVFDITKNQWMPPWAIGGRSIAIVNTSATNTEVILGRSTKKVLKMAKTQVTGDYKDDGSTYAATLKTNAIPITPGADPGKVADLEVVELGRNATAFSDVLILTDDEPINTTFTNSIFANELNPPLRVQGTLMLEKWYLARLPLTRRCAVEVKWAAADSNFSLIDMGFGSLKGQRR